MDITILLCLPQSVSRASLNEHPRRNLQAHAVEDDDWRAFIAYGYQALSLDENRASFGPTLLYVPIKENEELFAGHGSTFVQCWFPGVHTDVGGGYERGYRDVSDLSLAWMVDMCSSALVFDENLAQHLKKPSTQSEDPIDPKETPLPPDNKWGRSVAHDELHTAKFWLGGSVTRKPGQYFLGLKDGKGKPLKFTTTEYMHPSVRYRMMMGVEDKKNTPYKPAALAGFQLKKVEDVYEGADIVSIKWQWEKLVHVEGEKEPVLVVIEEDGWRTNFNLTNGIRDKTPSKSSLGEVQDTLLTDDVVRALNDVAKSEKIEMVPLEKTGWFW